MSCQLITFVTSHASSISFVFCLFLLSYFCYTVFYAIVVNISMYTVTAALRIRIDDKVNVSNEGSEVTLLEIFQKKGATPEVR